MKKISNKFHQRTITSIFWVIFAGIALNFEKVGPIFLSFNPFPSLPSVTTRLQNSPYFCVVKYAGTVKQKVWNETEKQRATLGRDAKSLLSHSLRACDARALRARKTLTPRFTAFFTDFEKKNRLLCSLVTTDDRKQFQCLYMV